MVTIVATIETVEDAYRSAMGEIIAQYAERGMYPYEPSNVNSVYDAIELLLKMEPVYITAACNFMGYPISYGEVRDIVDKMFKELGIGEHIVWN